MIAKESGISRNTDGACVSLIPFEKCVHPTRYLNCGSSQESQQWSKPFCAQLSKERTAGSPLGCDLSSTLPQPPAEMVSSQGCQPGCGGKSAPLGAVGTVIHREKEKEECSQFVENIRVS